MKDFRYIDGVVTLALDRDKCIGCGLCVTVCPHRVLTMKDKKAEIVDFDGCMECGACSQNCPTEAVSVNPGTGCAALIIARWFGRNTAGEKLCC